VVPRAQITAFCFIQSATTGFAAKVFPYHNHVSLKEALEGPEPDEGKLSRPVLRGLAPSNGGRLLGGRGKRADNFLTVLYQIDSGCRRLLWVG